MLALLRSRPHQLGRPQLELVVQHRAGGDSTGAVIETVRIPLAAKGKSLGGLRPAQTGYYYLNCHVSAEPRAGPAEGR